jgi:ADP-heptose:LPS heptosyltransferase
MPAIRSKIISRRIQESRPEFLNRTLGLKDFYEKRNKILINRTCGGLGDILMHRMMFEDFKLAMPDAEIHFSCPAYYHDALSDHPFIDKLVDCAKLNKADYLISYNTTTSCGREEMKLAPLSGPHRSDIWANHCGLNLTKHDMHFRLTEEIKSAGLKVIEDHRDRSGPSVLISSISAMQNKNLLEPQLIGLVNGLRDRGLCPFVVHNEHVHMAWKNNIPMVVEKNLKRWLGIVNQADYVVSVDTSTFHCAGGMQKPLVGIFTFADGMVYGKYYDFFLVQKHRANDPTWTCGPCYNWCMCPKAKTNPKPCLTEITPESILIAVDNMLAKWPIVNSTKEERCLK